MPTTRAGFPFETLEDKVLFYPRFDCSKHGLADDVDEYAKDKINEMTNAELLQAISDALQESTT